MNKSKEKNDKNKTAIIVAIIIAVAVVIIAACVSAVIITVNNNKNKSKIDSGESNRAKIVLEKETEVTKKEKKTTEETTEETTETTEKTAKKTEKKTEKPTERKTQPAPTQPPKPTLATPQPRAFKQGTYTEGDGKFIKSTWSAVSGADGYQVDVNGRTSNQTKCYYEEGASDFGDSGGIYIDLKVRAYANINGETIYSDWSNTVSGSLTESDLFGPGGGANNGESGYINASAGTVSGYTTDYVCDGGARSTVRDSLGNGWHVTVDDTYSSYGITWYECYDTDDGDYYGWVDSRYVVLY